MLTNTDTGSWHTAAWQTIVSGIVSVGVLVLVGMGKLAPEWIGIVILPLLGIGSMVSANKKAKENGGGNGN
jgi:hypothetical protein